MKLFSTGNPKTAKGEKKGYLTFILHLAPAKLSGYNVCPMASKGCAAACLNTAGRGRFDKTQAARIRKTKMFFEDRAAFMAQLVKDIQAGIRKATRDGFIPIFRLNGTSDIRWETIPVNVPEKIGAALFRGERYRNIFEAFPDVQFYDYTKIANRKGIPENYHLTFSRSESNDIDVRTAISRGMNVAAVFSTLKNGNLPAVYRSLPIVDGDENDLRFLDPSNCIVGLRAKGDAKKDSSGFVVTV
jgi:hypothetical protein